MGLQFEVSMDSNVLFFTDALTLPSAFSVATVLVPPTVVSPSTVSASATVPAPTVSADNGGVVVKMWNGSTWVTVTPVVM